MILQTTRSHYIGTAAAFRALGSDISDMLASIGLVKVPFAGQIDWSTVVKPTAARTDAGFEVWRFNDSLHATAPVYIRLGYGTGYSADDFGLTAAISPGVTEGGELTGAVAGPVNRRGCNLSSGSKCMLYVSGDSSRLCIRAVDNYNYDGWLMVERMAGADGLPGPDGALVLATHNEGGNAAAIGVLRHAPEAANTYSSAGVMSGLPPGTSAAVGADIALAPLRTWVDRRETRPLRSALAYFAPDLTPGNPVGVMCWDGRVRTYLPMRCPLSSVSGTQNSAYFAYLWE